MARAAALCSIFFLLPCYGLGLGIGMPSTALTFVGITDDWFDLRGTQTAPPDVKPWLWTAFVLGCTADAVAIFVHSPVSAFRGVGRALDGAAGIIAAVCGELLIAHVNSNTNDNAAAGQSAQFGSMVSVMMLLLLLPNLFEALFVLNEIVPDGP